jgi:chromate reductase
MRLLAISGSLRHGSFNSALLDAAAAECPSDVEFVIWRGLADIPAYTEDLDIVPAAVALLRDEIARSDAVLIATPEYNASVPGALKNALDWASRPYATNVLRNKQVAVIGASTGLFGALAAQAELRKVLKVIGASVLEAALPVPVAHTAFTAAGGLREPELALALRRNLHEVLGLAVERAA